MIKKPLLLLLLTLGHLKVQSQSMTVVKNEPLTKISDRFTFTEGPAADKKGNIYFTDQPNNTIWRFSIKGKLELFMENAGRSNGLYFDKAGNLLACADEKNELWKIHKSKKVEILIGQKFNGKLWNGPNDLWVAKNNDLYFTDPYYKREYWQHRTIKEQPEASVYHYNAKTKTVDLAAKDLVQPNGIIGHTQQKWLYVADIGAKKTFRFTILHNGQLTNKTLFCEMGSDGMTIDEEGNLYLTGKGVTIFNPQGIKIGHIDIPEPWTANVTFGGKHNDELFITASKAIYIQKMNVKGLKKF